MKQNALKLLFSFGRPFSPLYAQAMRLRAFLYRRKILPSHRLEVPVISVGNLTMGGTGKTPLAMYIAGLLRSKRYRPAIISRGYKAAARRHVQIVSDGRSVLMDPNLAGDEPFLMASRLRDIVVATGKKRIHPCRAAIDSFGCNVLILDDGFQHLAIHRSLDLVLFDVDHFAGNSRVFPGGELREPVSALQRCDAFILTGVTPANQDRADKCAQLLSNKFGEKPVIRAARHYLHVLRHEMTASGLRKSVVELAELPRPLFVFCAIARPERLKKSLAEHGIEIAGFQCFPDHYRYTVEDIRKLEELAYASGASGLLTTEKDMTKLYDRAYYGSLPFFVPVMEIPDNPQLNDLILGSLASR